MVGISISTFSVMGRFLKKSKKSRERKVVFQSSLWEKRREGRGIILSPLNINLQD